MKKIYSRPAALKEAPFHYCPGCGHSIIHRLVAEVLDDTKLQEKAICVPPAGCAVIAYNYFLSRMRVVTSQMDNFSAEFLNIVERHIRGL